MTPDVETDRLVLALKQSPMFDGMGDVPGIRARYYLRVVLALTWCGDDSGR